MRGQIRKSISGGRNGEASFCLTRCLNTAFVSEKELDKRVRPPRDAAVPAWPRADPGSCPGARPSPRRGMAPEGDGVGRLRSSSSAQTGLKALAFGYCLERGGWLGSN